MFDRHSPDSERLLNDIWNDLVRSPRNRDEGEDPVDPELIETMRNLHELGAGPPPTSSRERVRRGVLDSWHPTLERTVHRVDSMPMSMNGRTHVLPIPITPRRQPSWLGRPILRYAAAAILVLGIVLAFDIFRDPGSNHGGVPAIHAPATPSPEASPDKTVLEITLPATALPTGDGVGAGLAVFTIAPGTKSTWNQTCCPGVLVEYVLSGQYTVRSQAAITVVRAGGAVEEISARTEIVLNPGDSLVSRDEVGVEAANTGTEPVALLSWLLITGDGTFNSQVRLPLWVEFGSQFTGHKLPGWVEGLPGDVREMADIQGPLSLDAAPATIQLRRVTIPDDSVVPLPADGLQFVAPIGPHADKLRQADNSLRILGEIGQPVTVYILTLHQTGP